VFVARPDFIPRFADPQKMKFKPFQPNNLGLIRPLADKSLNRFAPFKTFKLGGRDRFQM
jgi:hypothetical protein